MQEQKKAMSLRYSAYIPSSVKSPLHFSTINYLMIFAGYVLKKSLKLPAKSNKLVFVHEENLFFPTFFQHFFIYLLDLTSDNQKQTQVFYKKRC